MKRVGLLVVLAFLGLGNAKADPPGKHGMMVFGTDEVYLSHLPMFHPLHAYQGLFRADFDAETQRKYLKSKSESAETVYTIDPENFVLPDMARTPRPFKAVLYRGHFERGGRVLARNVTVTIRAVTYFEAIDADGARPRELTYLVFGSRGKVHLAHLISAQPDFDHIVSVDGAVLDGVIMPGRAVRLKILNVDPLAPLSTDIVHEVQIGGAPSFKLEGALRSLYTEFDDLK